MDLFSILDGTPEPPIVALHLSETNTSGEYHLATPMFEFQKELTDQIVSLHYPDILKHCETNDATELITKSLQICVENCLLVATHPYLLIRHYMPKNLASKELPGKLAETSGKFSVLRDLLSVMVETRAHSGPKNVAVVMKNDTRLFDLAEALVLGCKGPKTVVRHVGNSVKKDLAKAAKAGPKSDPFGTTIHLFPHDGVVTRKDTEFHGVRFDVVVAMHSSVDTESEFVTRLRGQNRSPTEVPAVVIKLVPMFSIEHCLVHYASQKYAPGQLYRLVSSIVCLRDQIGNLPPDLCPIYNHHLDYLSHTFFEHVFRHGNPTFPAWPLPELCKIASFSPSDVERSLLTEVVYHYTPYDSSDITASDLGQPARKKKKTYYESKRLQLDYVTNPLRNDYNTLSGIHNHHARRKSRTGEDAILTHLLVSQLNENHLELALLKQEFDAYVAYNRPEKKQCYGRRLDEIKQTLSAIMEDVDHSQQRVQVTEKKTAKRTLENEQLVESQQRLKQELTEIATRPQYKEDTKRQLFIERQLQIWDLQHEVKSLVAALKLKGDEKSYMKKEISNCDEAMAQSETQVTETTQDIDQTQEKIDTLKRQELLAEQEFELQRKEILAQIAAAEKENEAARAKFAKTLTYLKETSHLKKRKGRGATPVAR